MILICPSKWAIPKLDYSDDTLSLLFEGVFKDWQDTMTAYRHSFITKQKQMKASEAKKIADSKKKSTAEIFEMIEQAADKGEYCCFVENMQFSPYMREELESLGYNIEIMMFTGGKYRIDWYNPTK